MYQILNYNPRVRQSMEEKSHHYIRMHGWSSSKKNDLLLIIYITEVTLVFTFHDTPHARRQSTNTSIKPTWPFGFRLPSSNPDPSLWLRPRSKMVHPQPSRNVDPSVPELLVFSPPRVTFTRGHFARAARIRISHPKKCHVYY